MTEGEGFGPPPLLLPGMRAAAIREGTVSDVPFSFRVGPVSGRSDSFSRYDYARPLRRGRPPGRSGWRGRVGTCLVFLSFLPFLLGPVLALFGAHAEEGFTAHPGGETTIGVVTAKHSGSGSRPRRSGGCRLDVAYTVADGTYTVSTPDAGSDVCRPMGVGDPVEVSYLPADPADGRMLFPESRSYWGAVKVIGRTAFPLGAAGMAAGLTLFALDMRRRFRAAGQPSPTR